LDALHMGQPGDLQRELIWLQGVGKGVEAPGLEGSHALADVVVKSHEVTALSPELTQEESWPSPVKWLKSSTAILALHAI
jgi:hypothetical protein